MSDAALSVEDALGRLRVIVDYDAGDGPETVVHVLVPSQNGRLVSSHWSFGIAKAAMEHWGVREAGPFAEALGHGLALEMEDGQRTVFLETRGDDGA